MNAIATASTSGSAPATDGAESPENAQGIALPWWSCLSEPDIGMTICACPLPLHSTTVIVPASAPIM
jgi:hypothetical protein